MTDVKVFAVIVTYKRAEILYDCLNAVLNKSTSKVYHVYIVVNSNDKATIDVIDFFKKGYPSKVSYDLFDNIGPAGGFHFGLNKFLNSDCDYVWLMDDDILPEPNCLEELLFCAEKHPYIFPQVLNHNGQPIKGFGWWGVLISIGIVKRVGLPLKEFFYWTEDTEYLQNRMIRKNKISPYECEEAIVSHLHKRSEKKPDWYYYYTIRNTLHYRIRLFPLNLKGFIILSKMFLGLFYRILFKEANKLVKSLYVFLGIYHAIIGKLGKLDRIHNF